MDIKITQIEPVKDSLNPEIRIKMELSIQDKLDLPLMVSGYVLSDDNKRLTNFNEVNIDPPNNELAANDNENVPLRKVTIESCAQLSPIVLDYISNRRTKSENGNVNLRFNIYVKYLKSKTLLSHMFAADSFDYSNIPEHYKNSKFVFYSPGGHIKNRDYVNMYILSGDSGKSFLEINNQYFNRDFTIRSSDWIHDFCPGLSIGNFLVYELKIPDFKKSSAKLNERIREAYKAIHNMKKSLIEGEWSNVIENSRPIGELFKNLKDIKDVFFNDGYTNEAYEDFNLALTKLFDYSSKFHHKLDREKNIMPEIKASQEDAYLIYSLSLSIANLISKKASRIN